MNSKHPGTQDRRLTERRTVARRKSAAQLKQRERRTSRTRRKYPRRFEPFFSNDRRIIPRLNIQFPGIVYLHFKPDAEKVQCKVIDFSAAGLKLESLDKLPLHSSIELCLYPPEIFTPFQITGKVVWRSQIRPRSIFQHGIAFNHKKSNDTTALEKILKEQIKTDHLPPKRIREVLENFIYQNVLRKLIGKSQLGSASLNARADSGTNFDHIYKRTPQGSSKIGKWVDGILLHLPAAQATRYRKDNLVKAIRCIIEKNRMQGVKTRIVDLGSGPARYLIEAITDELKPCAEAVCIDLDNHSVRLGQQLAQDKPIRYMRGNVLKVHHLLALSKKKQWTPNLIIASGLIYYYNDIQVQQLMQQVFNALAPGGIFLFSNMVFNPNSKLIGKLFKTQQGMPWIPIGRSPVLIRHWLRNTGFLKDLSTLDRWGMYALFTASKPAIINPADEGKLVAVNNIVNAKSEIVEFRNAGVTFRGRAFLPENMDQCKGIVIFVHGLGYCVKAYQLDPKQFTSANYFLFTYNLRGHADSAGEWTLRRSVEDLKICVKWLNRKYSANKRLPIGILAHSTGALIGVLAALEEPLIQYASVVSPVTSIYDSFSHWHVSGYNQSVKPFFTTDGIIPPVIESYLDDFKVLLDYKEGRREREDLMVPYRYGMLKAESFTNLSDAIAYSPDLLTQTDQIKMPMIIFSGKYDEVINVEKIHRFHEQIKSAEKMLIPTESANHFLSESWSTIHKETIIFFNQILSRKD